MMTLAVTGAPDSHWGPIFWRTQMIRGAPTALTYFFVGFRTDFVTSVRVSVASAGVLALAGLRPARARKPQGGTSLPPPGYGPDSTSQICQSKVSNASNTLLLSGTLPALKK